MKNSLLKQAPLHPEEPPSFGRFRMKGSVTKDEPRAYPPARAITDLTAA